MNATSPGFLMPLREGQFAELERHLAGAQAQFERGLLGEGEVEKLFAEFENPDPSLGEHFGVWLEACPESYVARTALSRWLLAQAWAFRGQTTMNLVSDRGRRGMHHFLEQAEACARHATTLSRNPLIAWLTVAYVHNTQGCDLTLEDVRAGRFPDWFLEPLEHNPRSLLLRRRMLYHLRTEWGGSEEHMLTFVRQQQDGGLLGQTDIQRLWAEFHTCVSHHALHFLKDTGKGVERARLAADLRELGAEQLLIALTHAKAPVHERRAALERYLQAAQKADGASPGGNFYWALYVNREWIEPELPRIAALLGRLSDSGDQEAAIALGRLRLINRKWTLPDPLPGLQRAREQGNREAAEVMVDLLESGPGTGRHGGSPGGAAQRDAVLQAANLGSEDMSWRVYVEFEAYREQFGLADRDRYRFLLRAADAGNNDARFYLAELLRAGLAELGEDGVLRPVDTQPLQDSLDYAKHLLERAAAEDHAPARKALAAAGERDWQEKTARRLKTDAATLKPAGGGNGGRPPLGLSRLSWWQWWFLISAILAVVRGCAGAD